MFVTPDSEIYRAYINMVRENSFNLQKCDPEYVDDKLLRLARSLNAWAPDAWLASLPKEYKQLGKERMAYVWVDIGIIR